MDHTGRMQSAVAAAGVPVDDVDRSGPYGGRRLCVEAGAALPVLGGSGPAVLGEDLVRLLIQLSSNVISFMPLPLYGS